MTVFRVDSVNLLHDTLDGEVIIINANTGNYYSVDRVGAYLWEFLKEGASATDLVNAVNVRYRGEKQEVEATIRSFLDELVENDLVLQEDADADASPASGDTLAATPSESFTAPVLSKFTDMQDLLLLDPIHDVDEKGWPRKDANT